jgi:hypothetical protein
MNMATRLISRRRLESALFVAASVCGLALVSDTARADDDSWMPEKTVSCSSDDGRKNECAADLRGYTVRNVDQASRTECVVGRNWGYNDRGVWVDDGCRATFSFDKTRGGDHPRSWGYRDPVYSGEREQRVTCESRDGRRNECDMDLRGYRIADVREKSRADCDIGRNFGYDDRGVWVDNGCRAEFIFMAERGRDRDERLSEREAPLDRR